jgi:hypothetical protein
MSGSLPPPVDRVGPTRRPPTATRGYQRWRSLLFLHWPVPAAALRPLVPSSLELDLHHGQAYVGVVSLVMQGVRPRWLPAALAWEFLETNVRTYVLHGDRPGVYFFSLDASSRLAVWTARQCWGLPYFHADMNVRGAGDEIQYQSRRRQTGQRHFVRYRPGELLEPAGPDTLAFFLLERYLMFVPWRGAILTGQVHHRPYPAQRVELLEVRDQLVQAAGLPSCQAPPAWAHYAAGVDVDIYNLRR